MGRSTCVVKDCKTNKLKLKKKFFKFPKDNERARSWAALCRRQDLLEKSKNMYFNRVCEDHFEENCFVNAHYRNRLLHTANPSVFTFINIENGTEQNGASTKIDNILGPSSRKDIIPSCTYIILGHTCAVPTFFLSKEIRNTVTETSKQVDNNDLSNVPIETDFITETEVKVEYDEDSWRNDLLLEKQGLQISIESKVGTDMTLKTEDKREIIGNVNNCKCSIIIH